MGWAQTLHRAGRLYRVEISQKTGEERRGLRSLLALLGVEKDDPREAPESGDKKPQPVKK